jgi:hypothetical protein
MPSFAGNDAPDRQCSGVAPLLALAAAVLVGAIVAWRLVVTIFDAVPQVAGEADGVATFVNWIIVGESALLLLLLLLSAIFLRSRRYGAFIETISVFFALSFLAVAGDALIWLGGLVAHVSGDLIGPVGPRQTDLADAIMNMAFLFVVSHIGAACLGIAARRRARAARTLAAAPQPPRVGRHRLVAGPAGPTRADSDGDLLWAANGLAAPAAAASVQAHANEEESHQATSQCASEAT